MVVAVQAFERFVLYAVENGQKNSIGRRTNSERIAAQLI